MTIASDCRECIRACLLSSCSLSLSLSSVGRIVTRGDTGRTGTNGGRCKREKLLPLMDSRPGANGGIFGVENTYGEVTKFRNERQPYAVRARELVTLPLHPNLNSNCRRDRTKIKCRFAGTIWRNFCKFCGRSWPYVKILQFYLFEMCVYVCLSRKKTEL